MSYLNSRRKKNLGVKEWCVGKNEFNYTVNKANWKHVEIAYLSIYIGVIYLNNAYFYESSFFSQEKSQIKWISKLNDFFFLK